VSAPESRVEGVEPVGHGQGSLAAVHAVAPDLERLGDTEKRRVVVRDIEPKLVEDTVRRVISQAVAAACLEPQFKGLTIMVNSVYNGWRFEDVWLDR
jgi:hypothetical protein